MHITITGSRGSGKSTLAKRLLSDLNLQPSGFVTLPYAIEGQRRGHYLHSLVDCPDQLNDLPISVLQAPRYSIGIPDTFATLGVACLLQSLAAQSDCVLLDEIGRFETTVEPFLTAVRSVLAQQEKRVLAVVQKEPLPFLDELCGWPGCLHLDLDQVGREAAYQIMFSAWR
ncbi:MAG: hypothetical protein EOM08_15335 [Clostridia bacterium]|nr:hypothetical protein [Clostridia bacterium]NCC77791.1 hypothetical protein [Clostridia bacterium]